MQHLAYTALEKLEVFGPVYKIQYLQKKVADKKVLDLGAYDETAFDKKENNLWIHSCIARVAQEVVGIDNSEKLTEQKTVTFDNAYIFKGTLEDFVAQNTLEKFDMVVAGEFVEHLPNTLEFFESLKKRADLHSKKMIITTPNATSLHNVLLGLFKRESAHQDHIQVYSLKTLHTLCQRAGFTDWKIGYYHVSFPEYIKSQKGIKRMIAKAFQKIINILEKMFPMLSGGLIVEVSI